jgi:hypothetical protein
MPVKIFYAQGNKNIAGLEAEINKWQESLGPQSLRYSYIHGDGRA